MRGDVLKRDGLLLALSRAQIAVDSRLHEIVARDRTIARLAKQRDAARLALEDFDRSRGGVGQAQLIRKAQRMLRRARGRVPQ